ncbi:GntR family transcriptional regulator [Lactiplantibacillus pentosus]|uniref:GntR family transcriptional regulator n=1 Tax=Lactiplantibacillus pentosus TaxID=1589 RepID=UPI001ADD868F|nr:GntR family transcriptional regulator [Lactiplantibacillus pentosus]MBO9164474.1 GntR family transcriptional regulator [Lactiplantibacillus pentosus]MCT3310393.1 GntR family transcriptional regulator [Lactiplantibacillus pentosus]
MQIDHGSRQPYYAQLVTGIEQDIAHGVLQPGEQLPSVREMARQHLLNPNTVSKAYKQLEAQQIIQTVPGKGTYVRAADSSLLQAELRERFTQIVKLAYQSGVSIAELHDWLDKTGEML